MKLDTSDIADLQPVIAEAVHAVLDEIRGRRDSWAEWSIGLY
jgi:hypothetical protein